jgi:hypothetical protein
MVIENLSGSAAFISDKNSMINNITSTTNGAVYLTDSQALDVNRIFSSQFSYYKGAMVLEMLRFKLGDTAFFQGMKNYITDPLLAYKYAITPQFQAHMEAVYGSSLQEFFNDWIYNQGYPRYSITAYNSSVNEAKITINQTQSHASVSYFEMPVPVKLTGAGGVSQIYVLDNTQNGQEYTVSVPFTVTGIVFDPEKHLISKSNTATLATDAFEYENGIVVYPNPANGFINISLASNIFLETVTITNILGQIVIESANEKINIASLANGVYDVKINTTAGQFHKKIIKD